MSMISSSRRIALAVTSVFGVAVLSVALANGRSTKDGAFTVEQAERGKAVYDKSCVNCHQADFYRERLARWQGKPIDQLFDAVSTTMPADNVGGLLTSEYVDVLAYIFSVTGSPAGTEELTSDNMGSVTVGPVQ